MGAIVPYVTQPPGDNSENLATTAFVTEADALKIDIASQGASGAAALVSMSTDEARAAAGIADKRIYIGSTALTYVLDPEDFAPAVHVIDPAAGSTIKIDVSVMRLGCTYAFFNQASDVASGTNGGIVEFDCANPMHFRGDTARFPSIVNVRNFKLYPAQAARLTLTAGDRIHLERAVVQSYWAITGGTDYRWRRWNDGTVEAIFWYKTSIAATTGVTLSFPTAFVLADAILMGVTVGAKADGSTPPDIRPVVRKVGVAGGLSAYQFELYNPAAVAMDWPVAVHFIGITEA